MHLILSTVLDPIATDLHAAPVQIARAISAYGSGTALAALLLAPRIERLGIERALVAALLFLGLSLAGSALSSECVSLALSQGLAGLCAGVALPAIYAFATSAAGAQALGGVLTGWSISLVAGVPLSALLTQWTNWRVPFCDSIGFGMVCLAAAGCMAAAALASLAVSRYMAAHSASMRVSQAEENGSSVRHCGDS